MLFKAIKDDTHVVRAHALPDDFNNRRVAVFSGGFFYLRQQGLQAGRFIRLAALPFVGKPVVYSGFEIRRETKVCYVRRSLGARVYCGSSIVFVFFFVFVFVFFFVFVFVFVSTFARAFLILRALGIIFRHIPINVALKRCKCVSLTPAKLRHYPRDAVFQQRRE